MIFFILTVKIIAYRFSLEVSTTVSGIVGVQIV